MNWKKWSEPTSTRLLVFFAVYFVAIFINSWVFGNRLAEWTERAFGISTFLFDWQFWVTVPLQPLGALMWLFNLQKILATGFLLTVSMLIIAPVIALLHMAWQYWLAGQITARAKQWNFGSLKKWLRPNQNHISIFVGLFVIGGVLAGLYSLDALYAINNNMAIGSETVYGTFWTQAVFNPVNAIVDLSGAYTVFQSGSIYALIAAFSNTLDIIWLYLLAGWLSRFAKKTTKTNQQ